MKKTQPNSEKSAENTEDKYNVALGKNSLFRHALLVEPVHLQQQRASVLLQRCGFGEVSVAENLQTALRKMKEAWIGVVFSPWKVEDLAGSALLGALIQAGKPSRAGVVLMDEGLAPWQVVHAVKAGTVARLPYPLQLEGVHKVLAELKEQQLWPLA